ncbi:MAG TPA: EamA family transporter [Ottowia sp.]|uniref:DMT family transporter n=1 Tax=Ottowia sp. TaxID=1898956 RepID=UPI002CAA2774|nr:EamA family transporter [Ottowia sp.]HMN21399.1 EamA family transporter [Ottowia sp.]
MPALTRRQLAALVFVTLVWGLNWPVLKVGVQGFPPLGFRAISMWLALPVLWLALRARHLPLAVARVHWPRVLWLGLFNLVLWNAPMIVAMPLLSSGRAAILGYTMPIFSALLGAALYRDRLAARGWAGVAAAALGVLLLLWNELASMGGRPLGVALMLLAAACWAQGTQMLRRSALPLATLTLAFWMMAEAAVVLSVLGLWLEHDQWRVPSSGAVWATAFNALLVLSLAQAAWFSLARNLPPLASTLSVMMIPVVGVFTGALWLGEALHWQDWSAMGLMCVAIASVLWPARAAPAAAPRPE